MIQAEENRDGQSGPHRFVPTEGCLAGRSILITGAGGSIGFALAGEILKQAPARLILLESSEHNLQEIWLALRSYPGPTGVRFCLGDVRTAGLLSELLETQRPDTVFHAAAFKHVPLLE